MENNYFGIQFITPNSLNIINTCINKGLITSPALFDKPLVLVKLPDRENIFYCIRLDYLQILYNDLQSCLTFDLPSVLKTKCSEIVNRIEREYSLNDPGGMSLEGVLAYCKTNNIEGVLLNSFENHKYDSFRYHTQHKHSGHDPIIEFFQKHGFGTNNPVMTYLSVLATTDRCVILEALFNPNVLNSILSDKLLLAYISSGKHDLAEKVIENSILNGESELNIWGLQSKLDLGLAPTRNRAQRIEIYNDFLRRAGSALEVDFLNSLVNFCNKYYQ